MRRNITIFLLATGAVAGFAIGFARLHYGSAATAAVTAAARGGTIASLSRITSPTCARARPNA